jgi:hypothetical protein
METGFDFIFDEQQPIITSQPYRELIGCLMYASNGVRAECAFAVNGLARYVNRPQKKHWEAALRVLRYLGCTRTLGLTFTRKMGLKLKGAENVGHEMNGERMNENKHAVRKMGGQKDGERKMSKLNIRIYVDADWGSDKEDFKSQTGYLIQCMGTPVIWRSRKQRGHSLSTMEAEFIALSEVAKEVLWIQILLTEMKFVENEPFRIFEDNTACIELAKESRHREKAKHINMRTHFVRELIANGTITLVKISTEDMVADMLTKALGNLKFEKHCHTAGLKHTGTVGVLELFPNDHNTQGS